MVEPAPMMKDSRSVEAYCEFLGLGYHQDEYLNLGNAPAVVIYGRPDGSFHAVFVSDSDAFTYGNHPVYAIITGWDGLRNRF